MNENIKMDFLRDWQDELIKNMQVEGLELDPSAGKDTLIIRFFSYLRKKGLRKPYTIIKSNEFSCPEEHKIGLEKLEKVLEAGEDLSPYLSKSVDKLKHDLMFNDWGILHFHLGEEMQKNGKYIERTGPLLFVYFKESNAYFLNVFEHGDWTRKDALQIIQDNWPELIEPYRLRFAGLEFEYSEEQHADLRNSGISAMLTLKDAEGNKFPIMPPGMGLVTSKDSLNDVRYYQDQVNLIYKLEDIVKEQLPLVEEVIKNHKLPIPEEYKFKYVNIDGQWKVREENTNLDFEII